MENMADKDQRIENSEALAMASLKTEIANLQADIHTGKRQNTSLKAMLYVGFIVLMAGYFYSSGMFKQSQADRVETSFHDMRNRVNRELLLIQKSLFSEILRLQEQLEKVSAKGPTPAELVDIIDRMNASVESLRPQGMETQELVEEISQNSREFLKVYGQYNSFK